MAQLLRDPVSFQQVHPATGMVLDFDVGADGRVSPSPSHMLLNPTATFEGRASGLVPLDTNSVSAVRGTIQIEGSYSHIAQAQTIVYISPGTTPHDDHVEVGVTLLGRASFRVYDNTNTLVVSVTMGKRLGTSFWIRFAWDSTARSVDGNFAGIWVDGQVDTSATWGVTPTRPWVMLDANYVGIRQGYNLPGGTWPMNGSLRKVLIEKVINTKF